MAPTKHYSQLPDALEATPEDDALLHVRGGGFVTRDMLNRVLDRYGPNSGRPPPPSLLIDLRDVAGYDSEVSAQARTLLDAAPRLGVERIAFVGSSTVLRTASRLADRQGSPIAVRAFDHERPARAWLTR